VAKSSIFGNHIGNDPDVGGANCGFATLGTTPQILTPDFWGAPNGPGPDPADDLCFLNAQSGPTATDPVAAKEPKIKPKAAL